MPRWEHNQAKASAPVLPGRIRESLAERRFPDINPARRAARAMPPLRFRHISQGLEKDVAAAFGFSAPADSVAGFFSSCQIVPICQASIFVAVAEPPRAIKATRSESGFSG